MPDVNNTIIWSLRDNVSAGTRKLNKELTSLGAKGTATGSVMSKLGVATGGLVTPQTLAMGAAFALVGGLVAVTKAAIDEQKNIAKLDAALAANVKGWNGDRKAIEKVISERENLAFSDDELRDSMALLVSATHDVGRAFDIQTIAMDLARLKGISLQDATNALVRVEGGQFRLLKGLGIRLKEGATQMDAFAAVTAVANGQAQAYADTISGKLERAQIRMADGMESLGEVILPHLADGLDGVNANLKAAGDFMDFLGQRTDAASDTARSATQVMAAAADVHSQDIRDAYGLVGDSATLMGDEAKKGSDKARLGFKAFVDASVTESHRLIDDVYGPVIAKQQLVANEAEIADERKVASSKKASAEEKRIAKATISQLESDNLKIRTELAAGGKLSRDELVRLAKDIERKVATSTGKAKGDWQDLLNWFRNNFGNLSANVKITTGFRGHAPGRGPLERAAGGPVRAGQVYTVGEKGPETLVMGNQSGSIIPNGAGGGVTVIKLVVDGKTLAEVVDEHLYRKLQRSAPTALRP